MKFNEAFMEDCIEEAPSAFLGQSLQVVERQPTIGGFRPDLVLQDDKGSYIILEIQQRALDRTHLYKCLEYRDAFAAERNCDPPSVAVFCEAIDERFRPIAATHSVTLHEMDRGTFIETAAKSCPNTVSSALLKALQDRPARNSTSQPAITSKPVHKLPRFRFSETSGEALGRLDAFCIHNNVDLYDHQRERLRTAYHTLSHQIQSLLGSRSSYPFFQVSALNIPNFAPELCEQKERWFSSHSSKRPKVHFWLYDTGKENLTLRWSGTEYGSLVFGRAASDFIYEPSEFSAGWQRPDDEVMFLRGIPNLLLFTDCNRRSVTNDRAVLEPTIDNIIEIHLANAFYRLFEDFKRLVGLFCEPIWHSDLEVAKKVCDDTDDARSWGDNEVLTDVRLFNVDARTRKAEEQWLSSFEATYGIDVETFLDRTASLLDDSSSRPIRMFPKIARESKRWAKPLTETTVRNVFERLEKHHRHLLERKSIRTDAPFDLCRASSSVG